VESAAGGPEAATARKYEMCSATAYVRFELTSPCTITRCSTFDLIG